MIKQIKNTMDIHETRKKESLKLHIEMKSYSERDYVMIKVRVGKEKNKRVWEIKWVGKRRNEQNKREDDSFGGKQNINSRSVQNGLTFSKTKEISHFFNFMVILTYLSK